MIQHPASGWNSGDGSFLRSDRAGRVRVSCQPAVILRTSKLPDSHLNERLVRLILLTSRRSRRSFTSRPSKHGLIFDKGESNYSRRFSLQICKHDGFARDWLLQTVRPRREQRPSQKEIAQLARTSWAITIMKRAGFYGTASLSWETRSRLLYQGSQ